MNKRFLACFLFCLNGLICTPSAGQEVFIPKPSKLITSFPFSQLTGGVIVLRATFDNIPDSLNFILDTGSGGISLDSTTTRELNIPTKPSDRTIRGIAGIKTVEFAYNHTLKLPGLQVDSLNFHVNDYELLSGVYGVKIDGIIGFSFFSRYIVRINYETSQVEVFTNGTFKYPKGGFMLRPTIAGLPMQYANLKEGRDVVARFFLDTGAGVCLMLSEEFVKDSAVISPKRKRYVTVTEGIGGKKEMSLTILKEFKLGPYKFKKMPVFIFEDEFNLTNYPFLGGLIGNDLLRRFNIVLNYAAREFHLSPNSHFRDPFDYSYSGLGLVATATDIRVTDIIPGSPADIAGLKVDDIIIGMENNLSSNLNSYKTLLQQQGSKLKLIIKRNGELMEKKLIIKSIY